MWMFTSDQDAAFLQAVGRMKQIWKELCLTRLDTAIQDNSVIDGVKSESYRLKHFAVSCPTSESLGYFGEMSTQEMQSQILVPRNGTEGIFTSCNGELVQAIGNSLVLRTSCAEERKVRIKEVKQVPLLSFLKPSSSFPPGMADNVMITVYRVTKAFHNTLYYAPEYPDEMEYSLVEEYVSLLRAIPEARTLFDDIDAYIEEVNLVSLHSKKGLSRIYPSFAASCYTVWEENTRKMLADNAVITAFLEGHKASGSERVITVGDNERTKVGQVLESYILHHVAVNVEKWVKRNARSQEMKLQALSRAMGWHTQSDFDVPPPFQVDQTKAIAELPKIKDVLAPVDKLLVLKRTVGLIREAIDGHVRVNFPDDSDLEMSTDDLIMVIVWVIVRAYIDEKMRTFSSEIKYIAQFHFVSSPTSTLEFTLCHFQVAMGWIQGHLGCIAEGRGKGASPVGGHSHADFMFAADTERSNGTDTVDVPDVSPSSPSGFVHASEGEEEGDSDTDTDTDTEAAKNAEKEVCGSSVTMLPSLWKKATTSLSASLQQMRMEQGHYPTTHDTNDDLDFDFIQTVLRCSGHCQQSALDQLGKFTVGREGELLSVSSAPDFHTVATSSGDVYTWGAPDSGRLGHDCMAEMNGSSLRPLSRPKMVEAMAGYKHREDVGRVVQTACGHRHVMCVTEKGKVIGWGDNRLLQLGVTTADAALGAKSLEEKGKEVGGGGLMRRRVLSLLHHSDTGEVGLVLQLNAMSCCGPVQIHALTCVHVVMVACGAAHSLCLDKQGRVFSWGHTAGGRLGHSEPTGSYNKSDIRCGVTQIECGEWEDSPVIAICAGNAHSVAMTSQGKVYSWGSGLHGRLGHGCHMDRHIPTLVKCLSHLGARVKSISAGAAHTMFLDDSGLLMGCGLNSSGQVGVASAPMFVAVEEGDEENSSPEVKTSQELVSAVLYPLPVEGISAVARIQCGPHFTVARALHGGAMVAWGEDCHGHSVDLD